jgi:hypothetical protein
MGITIGSKMNVPSGDIIKVGVRRDWARSGDEDMKAGRYCNAAEHFTAALQDAFERRKDDPNWEKRSQEYRQKLDQALDQARKHPGPDCDTTGEPIKGM